MTATGAGKFYFRFGFELREQETDEYGNTVDAWVEHFIERARARFLRGGETVMASRLTGVQPVLLTVWANSNTRQITTDWRAVNKNEPAMQPLNIRSVTPTEDRKWIDILCQIGVAT